MASLFNPQINSGSAQVNIQEPVPEQDNLVDALNIAPQVLSVANKFDEVRVVNQLTEGTRSAAEIEEDGSQLAAIAEGEGAIEDINTFAKIAAATKAGLPAEQARTRATTLLKRGINKNPRHADALRKAYDQYFGGTGFGSGGGSGRLTPEEKAEEKWREEVRYNALNLNITDESSAKMLKRQGKLASQSKEYDAEIKENGINGDRYSAAANIDAQRTSSVLQSNILAEYEEKGSINQKKVEQYKIEIQKARMAVKSDARNRLINEDTKEFQVDLVGGDVVKTVSDDIDAYFDGLISILDNQSLAKVAARATAESDAFHDARVASELGTAKALSGAIGESNLESFLRDSGKSKKALAKMNPLYAGQLRAVRALTDGVGEGEIRSLNKIYDKAIYGNDIGLPSQGGSAPSGESSEPKAHRDDSGMLRVQMEEAGKSFESGPTKSKGTRNLDDSDVANLSKVLTGVSLGEPTYSDMIEANPKGFSEASEEMGYKDPTSVAMFNNGEWRDKIDSNPKLRVVARSGINGALDNMRVDLIRQSGDTNIGDGEIQIYAGSGASQRTKYGEAFPGLGIPESMNRQYNATASALRNNPSLWEGMYDTPEHYMADKLGVAVLDTDLADKRLEIVNSQFSKNRWAKSYSEEEIEEARGWDAVTPYSPGAHVKEGFEIVETELPKTDEKIAKEEEEARQEELSKSPLTYEEGDLNAFGTELPSVEHTADNEAKMNHTLDVINSERTVEEGSVVSNEIKELIRDFEKLERKAYTDGYDEDTGEQLYSVGYGSQILPDGSRVQKGTTVTPSQAEHLFEVNLKRVYNEMVQKLPVGTLESMTQEQRDTIVGLAYNAGGGSVAGSKLMKATLKGDYDKGAIEFRDWIHVTDKHGIKRKSKGLITRRASDEAMYRSAFR